MTTAIAEKIETAGPVLPLGHHRAQVLAAIPADDEFRRRLAERAEEMRKECEAIDDFVRVACWDHGGFVALYDPAATCCPEATTPRKDQP